MSKQATATSSGRSRRTSRIMATAGRVVQRRQLGEPVELLEQVVVDQRGPVVVGPPVHDAVPDRVHRARPVEELVDEPGLRTGRELLAHQACVVVADHLELDRAGARR